MDADAGIGRFLQGWRTGETDAAATARSCLARIAAHDRRGARLSAMLHVLPDAVAQAANRDRDRAEGKAVGPLQGVPIVLKDNLDLHGVATTSGSQALAGAMPHATAPAVQRLIDAGAVVIGKTNLSEFSFEIRSRSSLGGDTRNPFAPHVTSGGSSGGTAVAVAAGFALAGIGTDTGGSIRIPAAYNGLVGLRPTLHAVSTQGVAPLAPSTDTVGPITRCVADAALLFAVLAPDRPAPAIRPERLRVGIVRQLSGDLPDIARGIAVATAALRAAGVGVEDAPPIPEDMISAGAHIVDEEFGPAFDRYLRMNFATGTAPASLAALIDGGGFLKDYDAVLRARAQPRDPQVRTAILARHARLRTTLYAVMAHGRYDALIYPPSAVLPLSMDNPRGGWAAELAACTGWPALVIPVGQAGSGLPLSVELLGRADSEPTLFALGQAIEDRVPPRPVPRLR